MIDREPLQRAINAATTPVYATTYREMREGFQEKYGRHWTAELARAAGVTPRTVQRWEQFVTGKGGQARNPDNVKSATREGLVAAGKTIDPISRNVPSAGLSITVSFTAPEDKGHAQRHREFTVHMSSAEAYQYVNDDPGFDELFDDWFDGGADAYGDDGDYEAENVQVTIA